MLSVMGRLSLGRKLSIIVLLVTLLVFSALTWFVSHRTGSLLKEQATGELNHKRDLLLSTFDVFDRNITQSTKALGNVFFSLFPEGVRVAGGETQRVGSYDAPVLYSGDQRLNLNFDKPDEFTRITGGNATVFARFGDDFLRITTSLKKENGQRATGTLLGKSHPGYQRLINGQVYLGKARLFGRDYMTEYKPVKDSTGRVIAILYVGFDFTEVFASLKSALTQTRLGETGHVFLVDTRPGDRLGKLLVHPRHEGEAIQVIAESQDSSRITQLLQSETAEITYLPADGSGPRLIAYNKLPGWNLGVGIDLAEDELTAVSDQLRGELVGLTLVSALAIVLLLFVILNREMAPLRRVSEALSAVGEGDLTRRSGPGDSTQPPQTQNEIELLEISVDRMVCEFRELVSGILGTTDTLNQSAGSLAHSTEDSRVRLQEQLSRTDQVATAVTEMSASIQEVARSVADAAATTQDAGSRTAEGQAVVSETEQTIKSVAEQGEKAAEVIAALKSQSESIGTVIDVIRGIAEQTNLLALNAAIEAARAGEQGRGFAVVADEVRNLAQRTQESTQQIQQMIESLQSESSMAVSHMETSMDYGSRGVDKATAAAAALRAIEEATARIAGMITQVAGAAEEQSKVAEEINGNIVGIRDLSESTAQGAQETANASENLAVLARDLVNRVSRFRL